MVVASFIILTVSLLYDSYVQKGQILDMITFIQFFSGAKTIILTWLILATIFFSIVFITKIALRTHRYFWIPLYICHVSANLTVAIYFAKSEDLGFASVLIIMAESVRMLMKAHSYIRTKLLYLKENNYHDF